MTVPILPSGEFQRDCGRRLRNLIDKLGLSQVEAGKIMGVSKHVLRNWLAGDNPVQPYPLYRLCCARGVDFNYVFLGDWSRLPFELAKDMDAELQSKLEATSEAARQEA